MVALRESPPAPEHEDSPPGSADEPPEEPDAPPAQGEPGQEILPEDETPVAEGDEPAAEGEPENQDPKPKDGPQKRIDQLTARQTALLQKLEDAEAEKERLAAEVEELRAGADSRVVTNAATVPEAVAKLKTVADVQARSQKLDATMDELQDVLDENPGGPDTLVRVGEKEVTRKSLMDYRKELRTEKSALQQHGQQIVHRQQVSQQLQQVNAVARKNHPWLADAEHPEAKAVREIVKKTGWSEITAAAYVRGLKSLEDEFKQRTGGKTAVKPSGSKVPLKPPVGGQKPEVRPKAATTATATGEDARKALDKLGKNGSQNSLAQLLEATGR